MVKFLPIKDLVGFNERTVIIPAGKEREIVHVNIPKNKILYLYFINNR